MAEFDDDRLLRPAGATIGGCKSGRTDGRCELTARKLHLVLLVSAAPQACGRMRSSLEPTSGRRAPFLVVPNLGCLSPKVGGALVHLRQRFVCRSQCGQFP